MKLMIVDDESLERDVLKMIIKKYNFGVSQFFEAQNGVDAVSIAKQEQMDLVLMDIKIPIMDGLTAAKIIKKEVPNCLIVFLTAYEEFEFADQTVKIVADDYLLKPVHPEDIRQSLMKFMPVFSDPEFQYSESISEHIPKIIEYIENNLHRELNLEILSGLVHLNEHYLSRLFKRETGYTITQYITMRRLEKAKYLLHHSTDTITEISHKCGFSDPNYFTRVFKKYEGATPSQYQHQAIAVRKKKFNSFGKYLI